MSYDQVGEVQNLFNELINSVPADIGRNFNKVSFVNGSDDLVLPVKLREAEAIAALKGIEAAIAIEISNKRFGKSDEAATIDIQHSLMFLFSTYLSSVNGYTKLDPKAKTFLKDTDLNQAQSITYRRMSANLYRTKDDKFYHIHGSLEASKQLELIGLEPYRPDLTDYNQIVSVIQDAVSKYTAAELDEMTLKYKQAGVEALKYEDFKQTQHGIEISKTPIWEVETIENDTPPVEFTPLESSSQILKGIKVIELCRVIAGPTIGKLLAEYGAEVLKVTSPNLPDVPFFQIDSNFGKKTCELDLKNDADRIKFEELVKDADVIVDGYRTNVFEKLGYGLNYFKELAIKRGRGFVYGSENCFGFNGDHSLRAGWQQIADCFSGVAWIQGKSLGLNEPMVPPFPMSDYGTGEIVFISILLGLYKRSTIGGSYWCKSSLLQYDLFLIEKAGEYSDEMWKKILSKNNEDVFKLRYYDSVDKISSTCLRSMNVHKPELFDGEISEDGYFTGEYSPGFNGNVKILKPVVKYKNIKNKYNNTTRPNGYDEPKWD